MTRPFCRIANRRGQRLLIGLAVAVSVVAAGVAPPAHAASPGPICFLCPPTPTLSAGTVHYSPNGTPTMTFSGQNYTPGGQVQINLSVPPIGGLTLATTTASTAGYVCVPSVGRRQILAGGLASASVSPTLYLGGPVMCGPYQAWDAQTGLWSNTVQVC